MAAFVVRRLEITIMKILNIVSILILSAAFRAAGSETNSIIGFWRVVKMEDMSRTTYFTNYEIMCFSTNELVIIRSREPSNTNARQETVVDYTLPSSNRLDMTHTEEVTSWLAIPGTAKTVYSYKVTGSELRLEKLGFYINGTLAAPDPRTTTYERVEGFTF